MINRYSIFISVFSVLFSLTIYCQKNYTIKISDKNGFEPKKIRITVGDKVIWQLVSGIHTTTSNNQSSPESWDANLNVLTPRFEKTFTKTGKYQYHCKFHKKHTGEIDVLDPVPVELTFFKAEFVDNYVLLAWQTATETNNLGFEIEKKRENGNWSTITSIQGNGTSSETHSYNYIDKDVFVSGKYYYRLKQIDLNGTYNYYDEEEVDINSKGSVELFQNYPNPFNPVTTIRYILHEKSLVQISVYNTLGEEVTVLTNMLREPGNYELQFDGSNLATGIYFLQLKVGNQKNILKMVLIR